MSRNGHGNVIPGPAGLNNVIHGRSVRRNRGLAAIISFRATWARILSIKGGRATSLPCSRELVAIMSFCLNNVIQRWLVHLNVSPTRSRRDTVRLWDL